MSPLNPVLGETCQRYAPDGTKYFAEQITHHPPISAGVMEGPEGKWRFEVIQEFKANLNGHNSVKAHKEGAIVIIERKTVGQVFRCYGRYNVERNVIVRQRNANVQSPAVRGCR